jgi:hypothetical protein
MAMATDTITPTCSTCISTSTTSRGTLHFRTHLRRHRTSAAARQQPSARPSSASSTTDSTRGQGRHRTFPDLVSEINDDFEKRLFRETCYLVVRWDKRLHFLLFVYRSPLCRRFVWVFDPLQQQQAHAASQTRRSADFPLVFPQSVAF